MANEAIRSAYQQEMRHLVDHANQARRIHAVNQYLQQFKWAFFHPYLRGYHIGHFETMKNENSGSIEGIFRIFVQQFYELDATAYYIDGYFKKRPSLEPFCLLIDQSVILCLQRDFAGAINILIPVIEGAIRHYLINFQNKESSKIIGKDDLIKVFTLMQETIRKSKMEYYAHHYYAFVGRDIRFTKQQVQLLTNKSMEFYRFWFEIIADFFSNNLYLDTRGTSVADSLNRHSIFHGFDTVVYYSLENYLRLFNCLHFLSWAFAVATPGRIHAADPGK